MATNPPGLSGIHRFFGLCTAGVLIFLYLPIGLLVAYSFNASRLNIVWGGFTTQWYRQLWQNRPLVDAMQNSLIVATVATVLSVVMGTGGAWLVHRYGFPFRRLLVGVMYVPIVVPEVIMGVSLLILFAQACEAANRWMGTSRFGLGFATVIVAHVTFCFPFVMVAISARLVGLDPALEEAAMDLGATAWTAFWRVILPYLLPAVVSGALMAFTLSMDELIVTYFTTGPNSITLPIKVFGMAKVGLNPMLNAISAVFIVGTAVLIGIAERLRHSRERA